MRFQSRRVDLAAGLLGLVMLATASSALAQGADGSGEAAGAADAACAAGDGEACLALGEGLYLAGGDVAGALDLFAQACDLDEARACFRLGAEREFPDFGAPDAEGALAAYTRACDLGLEDGCNRAGIEPAAETPQDVVEGPALPPETGADDRDAPVIVTAAVAPAPEETVSEAALPGFASEALPDLDFETAMAGADGEMALSAEGAAQVAEAAGEPTEEDLLAQERGAMEIACGRGEAEACEMFAAWLRDGTGGDADPLRARRIFSVICTQGSVKGCYELAWMMYDAGTDDLEYSRARFLFSETCKAGVAGACLQAGDMRRSGEGGRADSEGAARLYAIACEAGLDAGCLIEAEASVAEGTVTEDGAGVETIEAGAGEPAESAAEEGAELSDI
jgi:uncharacterized protein